MPPQAGESILGTLFADVHYFFSQPDELRPHHRFDRNSYVYVYHNVSENRGRLEIANCPGTQEQDALAGDLEHAIVTYDYHRTNYVNLSLNRIPAPDWSLPTLDPQNHSKYLYPLHGLDLYFRTPEDTDSFIESLKKIHNLHSFNLVEQPSDNRQSVASMGPVAQKLEQIALNDQPQPDRAASTSTAQSMPLPPQPPPTTSIASQAQTHLHGPHSPSPVLSPAVASAAATSSAATPGPPAYNPASPGAPETLTYREKTPPPADSVMGTGLGMAAAQDHVPRSGYVPQYQGYRPQQLGAYHNPVPTPAQPAYPLSHIGSPPPQAQQYGSPVPSSSPPTQSQAYNPLVDSRHSSPALQQQPYNPLAGIAARGATPAAPPLTQTASSMSFSPPPVQPVNLPSGLQQPQQPGYQPQYHQSQASQSIYSNYSYSQPGQATGMQDASTVHAQIYRPTEAEAGHSKPPHGEWGQAGPGQPGPGRLEQRAQRVEKGVNRFLKKLEKKL